MKKGQLLELADFMYLVLFAVAGLVIFYLFGSANVHASTEAATDNIFYHYLDEERLDLLTQVEESGVLCVYALDEEFAPTVECARLIQSSKDYFHSLGIRSWSVIFGSGAVQNIIREGDITLKSRQITLPAAQRTEHIEIEMGVNT